MEKWHKCNINVILSRDVYVMVLQISSQMRGFLTSGTRCFQHSFFAALIKLMCTMANVFSLTQTGTSSNLKLPEFPQPNDVQLFLAVNYSLLVTTLSWWLLLFPLIQIQDLYKTTIFPMTTSWASWPVKDTTFGHATPADLQAVTFFQY